MNDFERQIVSVAEHAAIACEPWVGKNNANAADQAAVDAMRKTLNNINIDGTVVIGEGERDEAPMLYIGEKVGSGKGKQYDLAVDPLEGTNLCAKNLSNSVTVLVVSPKGTLLHAPDTYMDKIAVGPKVGNSVSLNNSVKQNLKIIAQKLNKPVNEVRVIMLKRDRNNDIAHQVTQLGAQINFISDGDVLGAVSTYFEKNDVLLGIGAAPEGVLASGALKPLGGYFEGKLHFRNDEERKRTIEYGSDPDKIYTIDELVKSNDALFAASGVTSGDYLKGVKKLKDKAVVNSLLITKNGHEFIETIYKI